MGLINADKLVNDIAEHITVKAVSRVLAIIQGQPTVEAIPVEWIEEWGWKNGMSESMSLRVMIDDWEKENGIH